MHSAGATGSDNNGGAGSAPRWQPSLRVYLILMFVVLLCLLFPTISIFYFQKTAAFRDEQLQRAVSDRTAGLKDKAALLARSLSHAGTQAISEYNFTFLNDLARKSVINDPEFIGCQFVSQTSARGESAGFGFRGIEQQPYLAFMQGEKANKLLRPEQRIEDPQLPVAFIELAPSPGTKFHPGLIAVVPVYVGDRLWGTVNATFTLEMLEKDVAQIKNEWARQMHKYTMSFLTITCIFVSVGVVLAIVLTRPLLRSISLLREGVDKVSRGELGHTINLAGLACDEFVVLSRSFNAMTDNLRQARRQLDAYSRSLEEQVSERTRELQEAQAVLLAQAHEAGMAEMAVEVLHNIGNAITPVKVGVATMLRQLRESPLRKGLPETLAGVPTAIQASPDLAAEEKQRLTAILTLLPHSLREEHDRIIAGLEQMSEKYKYIENIISLQMHYARLKGKAELVDVNRVARDALNMLDEVIQKQGVAVETSFQPVAKIQLEESKLLQILINLIKNACEAMASNTGTPKKLSVATLQKHGAASAVLVSVRDTGCGFTPEEQIHFFTFGYSTKRRGSGFGLHSCANYLKANNGSIEATSPGPGLGAEFIIHLPTAGES